MGWLQRQALCLLVVSLCLLDSIIAEPILRRKVGLTAVPDQNGDILLCNLAPKLWIFGSGERSSPAVYFLVKDPALTQYRQLLKYSDQDIDMLWVGASTFFFERFGVDFREIAVGGCGWCGCSVVFSYDCVVPQVDRENGVKTLPDGSFSLVALEQRIDLRIQYTTLQGEFFDCPPEMLSSIMYVL